MTIPQHLLVKFPHFSRPTFALPYISVRYTFASGEICDYFFPNSAPHAAFLFRMMYIFFFYPPDSLCFFISHFFFGGGRKGGWMIVTFRLIFFFYFIWWPNNFPAFCFNRCCDLITSSFIIWLSLSFITSSCLSWLFAYFSFTNTNVNFLTPFPSMVGGGSVVRTWTCYLSRSGFESLRNQVWHDHRRVVKEQ